MRQKHAKAIEYSKIKEILPKQSKDIQNKFFIKIQNQNNQDQEYCFRCESQEVRVQAETLTAP